MAKKGKKKYTPKAPDPVQVDYDVEGQRADLREARRKGRKATKAQLDTIYGNLDASLSKQLKKLDKTTARTLAGLARFNTNTAAQFRGLVEGVERDRTGIINARSATGAGGNVADAAATKARAKSTTSSAKASKAVGKTQKQQSKTVAKAGKDRMKGASKTASQAGKNSMSILDVLAAQSAANDARFLAELQMQEDLQNAQFAQQTAMAQFQAEHDLAMAEKQFQLEKKLLDLKEKKEVKDTVVPKLSNDISNYTSVAAEASSFIKDNPELRSQLEQAIQNEDGAKLGEIAQQVVTSVGSKFAEAVPAAALSAITQRVVENGGNVVTDDNFEEFVKEQVYLHDDTGLLRDFGTKHERLVTKHVNSAMTRSFGDPVGVQTAMGIMQGLWNGPGTSTAPAPGWTEEGSYVPPVVVGPDGLTANPERGVTSTPTEASPSSPTPIPGRTFGPGAPITGAGKFKNTDLAYLGWEVAPYGLGPRLLP